MLFDLNTQLSQMLFLSPRDEWERLKFYYPKGNTKGCSEVIWSCNVSSVSQFKKSCKIFVFCMFKTKKTRH